MHDTRNKVSANWYSITSAITLIDGDKVFSVMNDHAQGGTSIANGEIQIMQNRNSETDDHRGMAEPIDEKDKFGNRIRVDATYYIDIYDKSKRASK